MATPILIVHGWSDKAKSFERLADHLQKELGTSVTTLDLADWVSLNDEITYRDLRFALNRAWNEHPSLKSARKLNVVSHSTGALIVRDWMTHYFDPGSVPVDRHVMLAPANFGSPLAHKGRAWYGRAFKGFRTGFQTGTHLLKGLELASTYTWDLAQRDLFGSKTWYGKDGVLSAVIVGNSGYGGIKSVVDEAGSDGTVRISTANLAAQYVKLHFDKDSTNVSLQTRAARGAQSIALGISDGDNHSSIAFKKKNARKEYAPNGPFAAVWLKRALTVRRDRWPDLVEDMERGKQTTAHAAGKGNDYDKDYFHAYQNAVARVQDDLGNPVEDYLLELHQGRRGFGKAGFSASSFQRKVIHSVHAYSGDSSVRAFYLDTTTLAEAISQKRSVQIDLDPQPPYKRGRAVGYPNLAPIEVSAEVLRGLFPGHATCLVDITVPRQVGAEALEIVRYG